MADNKVAVACLSMVVITTVAAFFGGLVFKLLWNWLIPGVFHGPSLTYWQAVVAVLLLQFIGGFFHAQTSK